MTDSVVGFSKAQMKIQQMAFMLVALVVFFSLIALIYFSISLSNVRSSAQQLQEDEAREIVRKLAGSPELAFTSSSDCDSCIDMDKALMLAESPAYEDFWNLDYLMIEKIYPSNIESECTRFNYPDCSKTTIFSKTQDIGSATQAFVTLARWDSDLGKYRYEMGKIYASGRNLGG